MTAAPDFSKRFDLTDEQFASWWQAVPQEDRADFLIFSGDDYLARFVCALDYFHVHKIKFDTPEELFAMSYYVAALPFEPSLHPNNPTLKNRGVRAWRSDAVQALYDRVRYRSARAGSVKLQNKLFELGSAIAEQALDGDTSIEDKQRAINAIAAITKQTDQQEVAMRAERTKRGLARARESLSGEQEYTDTDYKVMLKAARGQLGDEKVKALLGGEEDAAK